jgi:pimeloyl-ACP methyl ester carboxylesterase
VVAAPSFPLEDPSRANGLDRGDLPNEAQDIRFVITALLTGSVAVHIETTRISLIGHSDGADAVLQAAFEQGAADARVDEVIALAPDALAFTPITGGPPAVIVHGTADEVVDPAAAGQVVNTLSDQRFDVAIAGADHANSVIGTTYLTASFDGVVLAALNDLGGATNNLIGDVSSLPRVSIRGVGPTDQ